MGHFLNFNFTNWSLKCIIVVRIRAETTHSYLPSGIQFRSRKLYWADCFKMLYVTTACHNALNFFLITWF